MATLADKDKQFVWHPFTQMQDWLADDPLVIERAEGSWLVDTEGRRYLDGVSSLWVNVHGHCHPEINQAIRDQLDRVAHSTLLGLANVPSIELSREVETSDHQEARSGTFQTDATFTVSEKNTITATLIRPDPTEASWFHVVSPRPSG